MMQQMASEQLIHVRHIHPSEVFDFTLCRLHHTLAKFTMPNIECVHSNGYVFEYMLLSRTVFAHVCNVCRYEYIHRDEIRNASDEVPISP